MAESTHDISANLDLSHRKAGLIHASGLATRFVKTAMLMLFVIAGCTSVLAANDTTTSESRSLTNAFSRALKFFEDEAYPEADKRFDEFINTYTNSPQVSSAVLFRARSLLGQSNYSGAIKLLRDKLPGSGTQAEHYHYWIAESLLAQGSYVDAATTYSNLNVTFPESTLRPAAALGEARAMARLNLWPKVIELLGRSNGVFQTAIRKQPKSDAANRGYILLSQGLFDQNQFSEAERVLRSVDAEGLTPELNWQRLYWLCRVQLASDRLVDALHTCTNSLAALSSDRTRAADTVTLRGEILERLGRLQDAVEAYTNNLATGLTAEVQRHALFKSVGLMLKLNQTLEASRRLEAFIETESRDPALDVARLTLGELQLKASLATNNPGTNATAAATNIVRQAMTNFTRIILDYSTSPLLGKAYLDRGWCYWFQGNVAEAKSDFTESLLRLPDLKDQVIARFKLADTQLAQHDYSGAISNYNFVLQESEKVAGLKTGIFDKALYQLLRASIENKDSGSADSAVRRIMEGNHSDFTNECLLLYGEYQTQKKRSHDARQIFTDLLAKFPASNVRPETEFAIARSYAQESDWLTAAEHYDRWVTNHPQHALLPQAQFSRALAHDRAGNETNALVLFTNFVAQFPTNSLASWAQTWVADYYFNHGMFDTAEKNYLDLPKNFGPVSELAYHAKLMAGRSALARQGPKDIQEARDHFSDLVNELRKDTNAPATLLPQTYFALGDAIVQQYHDSTNSLEISKEILKEAIAAFSWITNSATNSAVSAMAPLAMGRIGDCYFEWAARSPDPSVYDEATKAFQAVLKYPQAGISARSRAEVYLGMIAERTGQPTQAALQHYTTVLYDMDPENFDPVWVKEAGVNAAQLCEKQERWDQAIKIYRRVLTAIPSLRPVIEKRIAVATGRLEAVKK